MSQGCALLILGSKGQRSRSWRMVIWKWFPDDNWLCNQPMIMKLHTLTHHESRMRPIDFKVKGQGHGAWLFENGFRTITDSVINLWSLNFIHLLTMSQGCALLILRSKGQGHGAWLFENGFRTITDSVINLWSWNFIHLLTMSQGCALLILRSKGQGHGAWLFENGFRTITDSVINQWSWNFIHLLTMSQGCALLILRSKGQGHGAWLFENGFRTITDSVINLWSWNFIHLLPMSQGCALLILGSKGQRLRSWRMVIWKWSTEIMVADLNLLGSLGDLYCFSNTFSMLLCVAPICCPSCLTWVEVLNFFCPHFMKFINSHYNSVRLFVTQINQWKSMLRYLSLSHIHISHSYLCLQVTRRTRPPSRFLLCWWVTTETGSLCHRTPSNSG